MELNYTQRAYHALKLNQKRCLAIFRQDAVKLRINGLWVSIFPEKAGNGKVRFAQSIDVIRT